MRNLAVSPPPLPTRVPLGVEQACDWGDYSPSALPKDSRPRQVQSLVAPILLTVTLAGKSMESLAQAATTVRALDSGPVLRECTLGIGVAVTVDLRARPCWFGSSAYPRVTCPSTLPLAKRLRKLRPPCEFPIHTETPFNVGFVPSLGSRVSCQRRSCSSAKCDHMDS